jgi:hypothetical protein
MKEERSSFLRKRTKKLLRIGARCRRLSDSTGKSFLLLFFKKEESSLA